MPPRARKPTGKSSSTSSTSGARQQFGQGYQQAGGTSAPTRSDLVRSAGGAAGMVDQGAGFVLGLLFWGWVGLPFLRGGPAEVKKTLLAKFFNKAPDGSELP